MIAMNQMRMVCDSTYILDQDQEHRHDTKIAELMGILDECLGDPEQKVVVFSQWERMTRLVAMELEGRGTGFRSLHGSVPSAARKELYDSFNMLPDCRVFLSTDAGSTGLNLQSASILVNLDLPWNPAVLEQRIGRIHRLGQKKNVTIINLIALDSIESRMLNLIGFKSELARGILDAGADTIFMNDDNHKRFMSTVEEIVAMPVDGVDAEVARGGGEEGEAAELEGRDGTASDDVGASGRHAASGKISAEDNDSLAISSKAEGHETAPPDAGELVARGLAFFSDLSRSLSAPGGAKALVASLSEKDPATGKTCIRIPIENEAAAAAALSTLVGLFSALGRGTGP
jgi:superfamily II DNA/RNA helicase